MISLSSIVKAKLLTDLPKGKDHHWEKNEFQVLNRKNAETDEFNEKRDSIISLAVEKSRYMDNEAKNRANSLIENAQRTSKVIMADAEKKGYEEGYNQGMMEGIKTCEREAEKGLQELQALVRFMEEERLHALQQQKKDLMSIAFEIAKKVMKQQVHTNEDIMVRMLEEILNENHGQVKVYLSEYQKTLDLNLDKSIAQRLKGICQDTTVKVVMLKEEDKIMIEAEDGIIDMSFPVQLRQLEDALNDAI